MKKIIGSNLSILLFSLFLAASVAAQADQSAQPQTTQPLPSITSAGAPLIPKLDSKDILFKQYSYDLQQYYMDFATEKETELLFYSYKPDKDDTLFAIAARCNIPYDTIASLNGIATADQKLEGTTLLLPTAAGLFVLDKGRAKKEKPQNSLEALIQKNCFDKLDERKYLCYNINGRCFIHIPEERLDQTTRAFFLDVRMKPPLDSYWLSSDYGYRPSPFGGQKQFHKGIDMAAPVGTKVYACKAGKVIATVKMDKVFGNYIVIKHSNGLSSIYAHLSKIEVSNDEDVSSGQEIGLVGATGQVTGPHLHFEIRLNGQPTNPNTYIKR